MPEEMLTAPELKFQSNIKPGPKTVVTEGPYKFPAPRNLYHGELEVIPGCMFMFLIDKQWVPKCSIPRINAIFMQTAMMCSPNDQIVAIDASSCKVNDTVVIKIVVGDALQ